MVTGHGVDEGLLQLVSPHGWQCGEGGQGGHRAAGAQHLETSLLPLISLILPPEQKDQEADGKAQQGETSQDRKTNNQSQVGVRVWLNSEL